MAGIDAATCNGCGKAIYWIVNENRKKEPFDRRPTRFLSFIGTTNHTPVVSDGPIVGRRVDENGDQIAVIRKGHLNHFITCKRAKNFKRGSRR